MTDTVGLVGLGFLGASIGERLLATGAPPIVFDLVTPRIDDLTAGGALAAGSIRELAERCDIVLVCVQTDEQCLDVLTAPDGVFAAARKGTVVCVLSTVAPQTISILAALAPAAGIALLEAPMAGQGAKSVADASMFVLAGGDAATLARAQPTLERFSRVLEVGPLGSGAALKLAHNIMVYVGYLGALEAVELARAAGVRDGLVAELTSQTGALSEQSAVWLDIYEARRRGETNSTSDAHMAVAADLLTKDLRHALALAAESGITLPASGVTVTEADQIYQVRKGVR